ncbi:membrane protein [Tylonycteris bat coronavirus HKU33]|uniref:Membrane protein n=2 Tax=Orthocoronavirinae TaxID=2501931 RepID=A0AAE6F8V3_9ALPC|nr:membrane protein [Tylonycteris bat coronavirus HKU33]QCX35163.1 membrane protein [Tylonycteris bat coronavirus HKU33]WCC62337.1 membrane protein [Bat Coronavirus TrGZ19]
MSSNVSTVPVDEIVEHLRNWNFAWNIILTLLLLVMQYGNFKYSKVLYGLKMLILWILWPVVLALSVFNAYANFNISWGKFTVSIIMACVTLVLWMLYFVNSFKLYRRTQTFWAFNPETDAIITLNVFGRTVAVPVITAPTGITLTVLNGQLLVEGHKVANGVQVNQLPGYVSVAKASTTIVYQRVSRSINVKSNTGWAFYVRAKNGDFSAVATDNGTMSEKERLLHLV